MNSFLRYVLLLVAGTYGFLAFSAVWDGSVATSYAGGNGSYSQPYKIATAEQLALFASQVNSGEAVNKYAKLTADIVLNEGDVSASWREWTPIANGTSVAYSVAFDGNFHTVSGVYVNGTQDYAALFGNLAPTGSIYNLFVDGYVKASKIAAGICMEANGKIKGCKNYATVLGEQAGGIYASCTTSCEISDCENYGTVSATSANSPWVGGIGALLTKNSEMTACKNYGDVSGTGFGAYVGGVCGQNQGTMSRVVNVGAVTTTGSESRAGGICGYCQFGYMDKLCNQGRVSQNGDKGGAGGLVGVLNGYEISNGYNVGDVVVENATSTKGGICALSYTTALAMSFLYKETEGLLGIGYFYDPSTYSGYAATKADEVWYAAMPETDFKNGKVAMMMSSFLGQTLWTELPDEYPVFSTTDNRVYGLTLLNGDDETLFLANSNHFELPSPVASVGEKFDGWFTDEDVRMENNSPLTGNMELYAHFSPITAVDRIQESSLQINVNNAEVTASVPENAVIYNALGQKVYVGTLVRVPLSSGVYCVIMENVKQKIYVP